MIIVTTTQVRPNAEIPFYIDTTPALKTAVASFINLSTNIQSMSTILSEDQLTSTSVAIYDTQEDLDTVLAAFNAAFPGFFESRQAYSDSMGITITRTVE